MSRGPRNAGYKPNRENKFKNAVEGYRQKIGVNLEKLDKKEVKTKAKQDVSTKRFAASQHHLLLLILVMIGFLLSVFVIIRVFI